MGIIDSFVIPFLGVWVDEGWITFIFSFLFLFPR